MGVSLIVAGFLVAYSFCVCRIIGSLSWLGGSRRTSTLLKSGPLQLFVFLGSGGHTGEMLRILENYELTLLKNSTLHVGYSDCGSKTKFETFFQRFNGDIQNNVKYYEFNKAREVNSSLYQSVFTVIITLYTSFIHVLKIRQSMRNQPHLVLLNGPGTCCILALWFKLWEILDFTTNEHANIVYVESLARINTLSLTGKILYYLSDIFVVQWPQLTHKYPRAKTFGILT